jgi:hypothetical protein
MDLNGDFLSRPGLCPFAKASYTIALHASEHGKFWHGALQLLQDMKALASQNQQNNAAGLMFNMGETVWPASMNFHLGIASELRPRTHPSDRWLLYSLNWQISEWWPGRECPHVF